MYTVKHNNIFFALLTTSFGHYGHHQASIVQKFEKGYLIVYQLMHIHKTFSHQNAKICSDMFRSKDHPQGATLSLLKSL